jgi:hypothetical protein
LTECVVADEIEDNKQPSADPGLLFG